MKHIVCNIDISENVRPCPTVVESDMPTFERGDRMDWGQMILALKKGYRICINPVTPAISPHTTMHQTPPPLQTR
jgi:hypothetical protein